MKKGFTLIELLSVIIILGVILAIAVPQILNVIDNAKKQTIDSEAILISKAIANLLSEDVKISDITKDNLNSKIGIDGTKYDSFGIDVINNEVVVTIQKGDYIGENRINAKVYGVTFDSAGNSTRTDDAVGLSYTVNTSTIDSDFDSAEIYSEMVDVVEDGNVFVKIPKFWIKKTKTENNNWEYKISKSKQDEEYYLPYSFNQNGKILPYILVGKYNASISADNTKLESLSDKSPLVSRNINQFRTLAQNTGTGYQLLDIHAIDILQTLFYIEFATLKSQTIMQGNTTTSSAIASGQTNSVTTASGSGIRNDDGKSCMKYRNIENLYGNVWQFVDGINIKDNQSYVSTNASNYASDVFTNDYKKLSYVNSNTNNYVLEMGYDKNNKYANYPINVGTYGSSNYQDYYYQNSGNRIALFGGGWYSSNDAGLSYFYFYYNSSYSIFYVGARFLKTPLEGV